MLSCWCSMLLFCGLSSTGSREVLVRNTGAPCLRCPRNGRRMECFCIPPFPSKPLAHARWEGWQRDYSPSPDTGQRRCACILCRHVCSWPAGRLAWASFLSAFHEFAIFDPVRCTGAIARTRYVCSSSHFASFAAGYGIFSTGPTGCAG